MDADRFGRSFQPGGRTEILTSEEAQQVVQAVLLADPRLLAPALVLGLFAEAVLNTPLAQRVDAMRKAPLVN